MLYSSETGEATEEQVQAALPSSAPPPPRREFVECTAVIRVAGQREHTDLYIPFTTGNTYLTADPYFKQSWPRTTNFALSDTAATAAFAEP